MFLTLLRHTHTPFKRERTMQHTTFHKTNHNTHNQRKLQLNTSILLNIYK